MPKYYSSIDQLVGNTPLLELTRLKSYLGLNANIFAKLEYLNPAGSAKDRAAKYMLDDAERKGLLTHDSVIIEPTSGNTGIGLAALAAYRGYKVIIVMPDTMSQERRKLMSAYGAELVLTDGTLGMSAAIDKANELAAAIPHSFIPGQFINPANAQAHFETTGPEIFHAMDGNIDYFVATVGTGGTLTGTGEFLKSVCPNIQIAAVEPSGSPVLSGGNPGPHGLQGIGAGFIPDILNTEIYDEVLTSTEDEAYQAGQLLARKEGILVGISSGAALHSAISIAKRQYTINKNIVVLLPDTGDRYLSTPMFD